MQPSLVASWTITSSAIKTNTSCIQIRSSEPISKFSLSHSVTSDTVLLQWAVDNKSHVFQAVRCNNGLVTRALQSIKSSFACSVPSTSAVGHRQALSLCLRLP